METNIEQAVDDILFLFLEKKQSGNLIVTLKELGNQVCALNEISDIEVNALCNLWEAAALLPTVQHALVKNTFLDELSQKNALPQGIEKFLSYISDEQVYPDMSGKLETIFSNTGKGIKENRELKICLSQLTSIENEIPTFGQIKSPDQEAIEKQDLAIVEKAFCLWATGSAVLDEHPEIAKSPNIFACVLFMIWGQRGVKILLENIIIRISPDKRRYGGWGTFLLKVCDVSISASPEDEENQLQYVIVILSYILNSRISELFEGINPTEIHANNVDLRRMLSHLFGLENELGREARNKLWKFIVCGLFWCVQSYHITSIVLISGDCGNSSSLSGTKT